MELFGRVYSSSPVNWFEKLFKIYFIALHFEKRHDEEKDCTRKNELQNHLDDEIVQLSSLSVNVTPVLPVEKNTFSQ